MQGKAECTNEINFCIDGTGVSYIRIYAHGIQASMANCVKAERTPEELEVTQLCRGGKSKEPSAKWNYTSEMEVPIYIENEIPFGMNAQDMYFVPIECSRENGYASPFLMESPVKIVRPTVQKKLVVEEGVRKSILLKKFGELIISV